MAMTVRTAKQAYLDALAAFKDSQARTDAAYQKLLDAHMAYVSDDDYDGSI